MGNRNDMNIIKFIESFLEGAGEIQGIVCKKCGCTRH